MNNYRRKELARIAITVKALSNDLAAVIADEERSNSRMAINTLNEIYSYHALAALDRATVAAAAMLEAVVSAANF